MTQITIDNFNTELVESTQGRAGTPDGNVFFDTVNDRIEFITSDELPTISGHGTNNFTPDDGITMQALYAFERQQRRTNTSLRTYKVSSKGRFKQAGAFVFLNGVKLAEQDVSKIRDSGFVYYAATGTGESDIDRVYFGPRSLNDIDSASQPYYLLPASTSEANRQAATPQNFSRTGAVSEPVQVYGDTSFGDTGAGNFNYLDRPLIVAVRPFGRSFGETNSVLAGISELGGFSSGLGLGDGVNDSNIYDFDDIITTPIAPFTGMSYQSFASPQTRGGFTDGTASFSVIINNTLGGSLAQVLAYLDALMTLDTDVDTGVGTYLPKRGAPLYTLDDQQRVVTKASIHIDNISTSEQQRLVQKDNSGANHVYPFFPTVRINVSDAWANDANGWGQVMYLDGAGASDFDTSGAVIVNDDTGTPVVFTSADVLGSGGGYYYEFAYAYDTNTQAGLAAGIDKDIVILVEGDGGAEATSATTTIIRSTLITVSALSPAETNLN